MRFYGCGGGWVGGWDGWVGGWVEEKNTNVCVHDLAWASVLPRLSLCFCLVTASTCTNPTNLWIHLSLPFLHVAPSIPSFSSLPLSLSLSSPPSLHPSPSLQPPSPPPLPSTIHPLPSIPRIPCPHQAMLRAEPLPEEVLAELQGDVRLMQNRIEELSEQQQRMLRCVCVCMCHRGREIEIGEGREGREGRGQRVKRGR